MLTVMALRPAHSTAHKDCSELPVPATMTSRSMAVFLCSSAWSMPALHPGLGSRLG